MKKRILSVTLAIVMCSGLAVSASAYETSKPGQPATVSSGFYGHTGIVDPNGSLWMYGMGDRGELGVEIDNMPANFIKVMDGVYSVSCGDGFTAAIKTDNSLWMWGNNYDGALTGTERQYGVKPKKVMDDVVAVSCGTYCTAAIKTDGSLWTWGNNRSGQLGNGTTESSDIPIRIMENVAAVSMGGTQAAAIKTDGSLWTWGSVYQGQLANWHNQATPVKIMDNVVAVSCGYWNTAAIKSDGSLWIWGANDGGQLANGELHTFEGSAEPRKVLDNVAAVSCGGSQVAAVTTDGSLWTWGDNGCGELGNGYTGTHTLNDGTSVQLTPAVVAKDVAFAICGHINTFIVKKDGSVWGCGRSYNIGGSSNGIDKNGSAMQTIPIQIPGVTAQIPSTTITNTNAGGLTPTTPTIPATAGKSTFTDVDANAYYAEPVKWAVEKTITSGTSATTFSPDQLCSTAQILTFLWRSKGSPEPTSKTNPFTDVKETDYYYKAALWAKENNVLPLPFNPDLNGDTPCTRGMAVMYIWRVAGFPAAEKPSNFTDVAATTIYAPAVDWAVEIGVTSGTSATTFSPEATCSRGQIVTFLYRAYGK